MFSCFQHNSKEAERLMNNDTQTATVGLKLCSECGLDLLPSQRFCRLCGVSSKRLEFVPHRYDSVPTPGPSTTPGATDSERNVLAPVSRYRPISARILNSFAATQFIAAPSNLNGRTARRIVAAVITLPLWLMIVLLSPLDALEVSRQVTQQF